MIAKYLSLYRLYILLVAFLLTSCLDLDDNLFNPTKTDEYLFEAADDKSLPDMGPEYDINENQKHLFTLSSDNNGSQATIYAIYLGDLDSIANDTVILYLHGNYGSMDYYWNRAKLLAHIGSRHRFGVLMIDYRGYGMSEGEPSEENLYADTEAALIWLQNNGLTDDRLIVYGFSMGTAPATELTARPRQLIPSKLILEAPFASAEVMTQDATGLAIPGQYVTNLKIDNAEEIKKVSQPFMWLHGQEDTFLRIDTHGKTVADNYKGTYIKRVVIARADHGDLPAVMGYESYLSSLKEFIIRP